MRSVLPSTVQAVRYRVDQKGQGQLNLDDNRVRQATESRLDSQLRDSPVAAQEDDAAVPSSEVCHRMEVE